jgi:hypothetical protein
MERTNANLEEVQMYESANVVVGPMVFVGDKAIWA